MILSWLFPSAPLNITSGFILTYTAGETALYSCGGAAEGSRSFLCVNSCATQKDVLIDTTNRTAWAGRFGLVSTPGGWYVLIVHATVGDTGFYLCGYDASGSFLALVDGDELPAPAPATKQPDVCFLLTVGLFLVGVLLGGCAMLLYKWMRQRNLDQKPSEPQHAANINKVTDPCDVCVRVRKCSTRSWSPQEETCLFSCELSCLCLLPSLQLPSVDADSLVSGRSCV